MKEKKNNNYWLKILVTIVNCLIIYYRKKCMLNGDGDKESNWKQVNALLNVPKWTAISKTYYLLQKKD